jgi:hypothetical protein
MEITVDKSERAKELEQQLSSRSGEIVELAHLRHLRDLFRTLDAVDEVGDNVITCRVNDIEKQFIEERAAHSGLKRGPFLREMLVYGGGTSNMGPMALMLEVMLDNFEHLPEEAKEKILQVADAEVTFQSRLYKDAESPLEKLHALLKASRRIANLEIKIESAKIHALEEDEIERLRSYLDTLFGSAENNNGAADL